MIWYVIIYLLIGFIITNSAMHSPYDRTYYFLWTAWPIILIGYVFELIKGEKE